MPVPDSLSKLMHQCTSQSCSFCVWRRDNPGARLLDDSLSFEGQNTLCGVSHLLSSSRSALRVVNTVNQQFLSHLEKNNYDFDFPLIDSEFEQILSQVDCAISTAAGSSLTTTNASTIVLTSTRKYASPKGKEAVKAAKINSVPLKTRNQTDWAV